MRTPICDEFGIEYPILAFTPSEHVAAAVSRAASAASRHAPVASASRKRRTPIRWCNSLLSRHNGSR